MSSDKLLSFLVERTGVKPLKIYILILSKQGRGGQRDCLISASFQLPLAQNNPHAKETPFGKAYSGSRQAEQGELV